MPRSTPSHSGLKLSPQPSLFPSLQSLAEAVNDWCSDKGFVPASGQAAENLSQRSLRYYRTLGLLDGPLKGEGTYGERHFLQLASIRALQSRGMPLRRIQELLYGRDNANLRELLTRPCTIRTTQSLGCLPSPRFADCLLPPAFSNPDSFIPKKFPNLHQLSTFFLL